MKEKTNRSITISVVVALHILLVICFIIQGCGTLTPMKRAESPARKHEVSKIPMPEPEPVKEEIRIPTEPPVMKDEKEPLPVITTKYVVRSGDTLTKIAKRYNLKVAEIVALNKIKDTNRIREGEVILLPGDIKIEPPPVKQPSTKKITKPASAEVKLPVGDGKEYMVKPGDSLSKIAKEYKTTVKALKEANALTSDRIIVGQKLIVPDLAIEKKNEITTKTGATPSVGEEPVPPEDAGLNVTPQPSVAPSDVAPSSPDVGKSVTTPSAGTSSGVGYVTIHTVAPGETLESIARAWLVDKNAIKEVNNLTNDIVSPGQVLKIPLTK